MSKMSPRAPTTAQFDDLIQGLDEIEKDYWILHSEFGKHPLIKGPYNPKDMGFYDTIKQARALKERKSSSYTELHNVVLEYNSLAGEYDKYRSDLTLLRAHLEATPGHTWKVSPEFLRLGKSVARTDRIPRPSTEPINVVSQDSSTALSANPSIFPAAVSKSRQQFSPAQPAGSYQSPYANFTPCNDTRTIDNQSAVSKERETYISPSVALESTSTRARSSTQSLSSTSDVVFDSSPSSSKQVSITTRSSSRLSTLSSATASDPSPTFPKLLPFLRQDLETKGQMEKLHRQEARLEDDIVTLQEDKAALESSVSKLKKLNSGLENEMLSLQQKEVTLRTKLARLERRENELIAEAEEAGDARSAMDAPELQDQSRHKNQRGTKNKKKGSEGEYHEERASKRLKFGGGEKQ